MINIKDNRVHRLINEGYSHRAIRDITGISVGDISNIRNRPYKKVVGAFGDTHIPFNHPKYLDFIRDTFYKHGVTDIVCMGDLVDNHAISRHQSDPDAMGAIDEYTDAKIEVSKFVKEFPVVKYVIGNHDAIPQRQVATLGMPSVFIKDYHELWGLPYDWEISDEHIIDGVCYIHGIGAGGKDGAYNLAIKKRMSTVIGHAHAFAGVKYQANRMSLIYGANCGCGVDNESYAMAYGKHFVNRAIMGCCIIYSSTNAIFVPMSQEYFRG